MASSTRMSSIVLGTGSGRPSAMPRIVRRRILPDRVFGRPGHDDDLLERRHRADLVADRRRRSPAAGRSASISAPALSTTNARGTWPLSGVVHADDRALGHQRVGGHDGLHGPGREPVTGDVDHVVGAAHDEDVAVLVEVAAVAGGVAAGEARSGTSRCSAGRRPTGSAACPAAAAVG